ncbi:hypothetical protein, partial [Ralstonia pseudosolanacearum]
GTTRKRRKTCSIGTSFPRCGNLEQDGSRFHSRTPLISVSLASAALSFAFSLPNAVNEHATTNQPQPAMICHLAIGTLKRFQFQPRRPPANETAAPVACLGMHRQIS